MNSNQNPGLVAWLWEVMKNEKQQALLQKILRQKRLGVRINLDSIYIQQVENDDRKRPTAAYLPPLAPQAAFRALCLDL